MDYETEEQQLEAIKKWWQENSSMIITGIAVGVAAIFGWQYYQNQSTVHGEQASILYENVAANVQLASTINDQQSRVNKLMAEYSDTPYASLSALLLAKQQLAAGDPVKAQQQLQWVVDNAQQEELRYLARIRLSRVMLANNQNEQALTLVSEVFPESFRAIALELKGDVLLTMGKNDEAKQAYVEAQNYADNNQLLQLKIDDLGGLTPMPTSAVTEKSEPSA